MKKSKIIILLTLFVLSLGGSVSTFAEETKKAPNGYETPEIKYEANCPNDYYSSLTGLKSTNLLNELATLTNSNHKYYNSYNELRGANCYSDADPKNPKTMLIDFYTGSSIDNSWTQSGTNYEKLHWNREHIWCQSLLGVNSTTSYSGSDIHHVRPEIISINSSRNNSLYGDLNDSKAVYFNTEDGCGATKENGIPYGYLDGSIDSTTTTSQKEGVFEPLDFVKGDIARIIMYLYTHYSNKISVNTDTNKHGNLVITNIVYTTSKTDQAAWDLLMNWNDLDPVDTFEMNRNNYCASVTGTRNPYIDHPEYARIIWDKSYSGSGANGGTGTNEDIPSTDTDSSTQNPGSSSDNSNTTYEVENFETSYLVDSTSSVSKSGDTPEGVSASFKSTYSTAYQLTKGNTATLTISGLKKCKLTKVILSMKSNTSSGSGILSIEAGNTSLKSIVDSSFSSTNWNGSWATSYVDIELIDFDDYMIDGEDLTITIKATANSIYIKKYTLFYEKYTEIDDDPTVTPEQNQIGELVKKYYNNGVYTKKTNINLSKDAISDIEEYFHGNVDLDRTTYYKGNALLMGDIDGGFDQINSGYGTDSQGNMTHFTWDNANSKAVVDYTVIKGQHENWKDKEIDGMEGFYVTLNDMLQENYFNGWTENEYTIENNKDTYLSDFIAFVAPCLYETITQTNYITLAKLVISEETHDIYGDYLSLKITLDPTSKGISDKTNPILAEARIYQENVIFDENEKIDEPEKVEQTIYSETFENFKNETEYNVSTPKTYGKWDVVYGCNSTTNAISGSKSLQMRWYTYSSSNIGTITSNEKFYDLTSMTFKAASTNGLNVSVEVSSDGVTWENKVTYTLSDATQTYTYDFDNNCTEVYIRFTLTVPSKKPSSTSRVYIDDIVINGYVSN